MIVYDDEQGSPEWHAARAGVTTASMFSTARGKYESGANKGQPLKGALDYAFGLAIERISGLPLDDGFETFYTRRGHELEPVALDKYETLTGNIVTRCGFVSTDDRKFGCSADGLVGDAGGVEVKCWTDPVKLRAVLTGDSTDAVSDQCLGGMWLTRREWWDFVLYCPALEAIGRDLTVIRIHRDEDKITALEADLVAFDKLVEGYREQLEQAA